ncbi:MAG: shikimate kinase [Bacteroidia bacterium]|nr:shikimate kinase [Bacteroidia bacterium]
MLGSNIVYIIGFMGSGKSTAGKKLASLLGWSFIDLDKRIEEHTGRTISEIFSQHGEIYFRNVESEILKILKSQTNTIISTGGGTPCYGDNMDHMLKTGLTVYLKLTPGQLKSRLSESTGERPLINDLSNDGLLSFIEEKLAYREKCYNRAEIIVEGITLDINLLNSLIKSSLNI